jgi:hypothetical protein
MDAPYLSVLYVEFQVPDHDGASEDSAGVVATGVAGVVPGVLVHPAVMSIPQTMPARIITGIFFID